MSTCDHSIPTGTRPIPSFKRYRIDRSGTVYSVRRTGPLAGQWAPITWKRDAEGYCYVMLRPDEGGNPKFRYVHRVVLEAFVGPCPEGMQACHGPDFDKANNSADNLRWDTPQANRSEQRRRRKGLGTNKPYTLNEANVREIRERLDRGESKRSLARVFGVHHSTIIKIGTRQMWASVA